MPLALVVITRKAVLEFEGDFARWLFGDGAIIPEARLTHDGLRVLVTRYRPRGLPKSQETWDIWMRELAPSVELHAAFYGKSKKKISWCSYRAAFLREMRASRVAIRELVERIRSGENITLLCSSACVQDNRCHRSLLRELITAETREHLAA